MKKTWKVEFENRSLKELRNLDKKSQSRILDWLDEYIATDQNPRRFGKSLGGKLKGLWRYRIGNYRVISQVQDETVLVLIIRIGHRKDIYK